MKWHCVKNPMFSRYCSGTPEWEREPVLKQIAGENATGDYIMGTCKLEPETCGKCQSLLEQIPKEELEKISKPTFVETVIPIKKEEMNGTKPKSAKAKKLEAEMAQRSMF